MPRSNLVVPSDGKRLEALVGLIEKLHLPPSFKISTNERVYSDDGIQIAEFDVQVEGRIGTTDIKWLIECRDRPSNGPAPCSWIEQLIGRKQRFNFNKVTAVSTTGFASGVPELAASGGIELREVNGVTAKDFADWLLIDSMPLIQPSYRLIHGTVYAANEEPERRRQLFDKIVKTKRDERILWHTENREYYSIGQAFRAVLSERKDLFDGIETDGVARPLILRVQYPDDDSHFIINTELGDVRIRQIDFQAELSVKTTQVAVPRLTEYVRSDSGTAISQSAAFEFSALGAELSLEMHKLESGETNIVLRTLGPSKKTDG